MKLNNPQPGEERQQDTKQRETQDTYTVVESRQKGLSLG
jgi:hypothetical protein